MSVVWVAFYIKRVVELLWQLLLTINYFIDGIDIQSGTRVEQEENS